MKTDVFYTPYESEGPLDSLNRRISMLLNRAGFFESLEKDERVAVKIHPGERNNITYVRPSIVRAQVEQLKKRGFPCFVTETTTLYCRERFTTEELIETASYNGFSSDNLSCEFLVADSIPGASVSVDGEVLKSVEVAGEIARSAGLLVITHATGHGWTAGFAGSIKQLGMGCTSRKTKALIHKTTTIHVNEDLCNGCGKCAKTCKSNGIEVRNESAVLNESCTRCGVCTGICSQGAITATHDYQKFAKALAESARGVLSLFDERVAFVNILADITPHCDCEDFSARRIFPDIGVLVSRDPVAVDQASCDLINSAIPIPGSEADTPEVVVSEDKLYSMFGIEWWRQLEHAQKLGCGTRTYDLVKMKK
ncbi:MAG: DUF362 domain-containing protein [Actinomycetota bacterium]|nr:DUF362 domain-containing protein [Actinomycetota bacterium]